MTHYTHGDAQDLLAAFKHGWEHRSPDEILDLLADDVDYRPDPFSDALHGQNAVRALWNEMAASQVNVEFDAERIWLADSTVLASWHGAYTRLASAERVRVRGFMTLELDAERRVVRFRQWPFERVVGVDEQVMRQGRVA